MNKIFKMLYDEMASKSDTMKKVEKGIKYVLV